MLIESLIIGLNCIRFLKNKKKIIFFRGVTGHFDGEEPWTQMEYKIKPLMADLIGNF